MCGRIATTTSGRLIARLVVVADGGEKGRLGIGAELDQTGQIVAIKATCNSASC